MMISAFNATACLELTSNIPKESLTATFHLMGVDSITYVIGLISRDDGFFKRDPFRLGPAEKGDEVVQTAPLQDAPVPKKLVDVWSAYW